MANIGITATSVMSPTLRDAPFHSAQITATGYAAVTTTWSALSVTAGIWSELQRVPVGSDPHDLIMNDLNGDGFDDVLVGNRGSNTISVLLGGVDGLLGDQQIFQVGEGPQSLTALDYDDDGDLDLAVLTVDGLSTEGGVSIYRNDQESGDADLTFGLEQTLHDGEVVLLLGAGDVDGDASDDLVSVVAATGLQGDISSVEIRSVDSTPCTGDANGDQVVNVDDILLIVGAWGTPDGDVTGDGLTDVDDVLLCISQFGECG